MVTMLEFLSAIPCVGIIVAKISNWIVDEIVKRFKYLFCHKGLLKELSSKREELKVEQNRMVVKAEEERCNGKLLEDDVLNWQNKVGNIQENAENFLRRYENRFLLDCIPFLPISSAVSDYKLGKEAAKKVESINNLTTSGRNFLATEIARSPPPHRPEIYFLDFQSRVDAYEELWKQLVSKDSSPILGIYGLPGVGKTQLMEHISKKAEEKKIFRKVTKANVGSEELDLNHLINLQKQIAEVLNCNFGSEDNVSRRASQLKVSIKNTGNILIVFDDVWGGIPLDTIGIPCADECSSMDCKILYTSREKIVCLGNNCTEPVMITPLTVDESWDLFSKTVGTKIIDSLENEPLAKGVCNECGGLPLVICAVGRALKFLSRNVWEEALKQLRQSKIESVPKIDPKVYACLKLSFDKLPEQAKACMLLSSIFPEDADIPIRKLIILATGSQHVPEGKMRVRAMVDILKSSSLLLGSSDDEHFKLHDIIRDVARSIAVTDCNYAYLFSRCGSRFPYNGGSARKLIHLELETNDLRFPPKLQCPDVLTFSLLSATIFAFTLKELDLNSIFVNLRFLMLNNIALEQQFCLQPLGQLETLFLDNGNISRTDVSFFPENLETLCMWDCFLPVPLVLPNLQYLRKLEILVKESKVEPPVSPNLQYLKKQETLGGQSYGEPLISSPKLHYLQNRIPWGQSKVEMLVSPNLQYLRKPEIFGGKSKVLPIRKPLHMLETIRGIYTQVVFGVNTISSLSNLKELYIPTGFRISNCTRDRLDAGEYYPISGEMRELRSLKSLQMLFRDPIECKDIFSNLEEFNIRVGEPTGYISSFQDSIVSFKRSFELSGYHFEAFQSLIERAEELSLANTNVQMSNIVNSKQEAFADLRYLYIGECHAMEHLASMPLNEIQESLQSLTPFSKLTILKINRCYEMKYTFCNNVANGLIQLQELSVVHCHRMKVIVMNEGISDGPTVNFPKLKSLELSHLSKLKSFYRENKYACSSSTLMINNSAAPSSQSYSLFDGMVAFPSLEHLILTHLNNTTDIWGNHYSNENVSFCQIKRLEAYECNKLKFIIPLEMLHRLQNLEYLKIECCSSLISEIGTRSSNTLAVYPLVALRHIELQSLPSLTMIGLNSRDQSIAMNLYPNLVKLNVSQCNRLRTVLPPSIARDLVHLREMCVNNCGMMRKIIGGDEENTDTIVFPGLKVLRLDHLPDLTSFWCYQTEEANKYKVDFPSLEHFSLSRGEMNLEEIEWGRNGSTCQLKNLDISCGNHIQLPSKWLLRLNNPETLILKDYTSHEQISQCFRHIAILKIHNFGCCTLFGFSAFESLQELQELEISGCALLEKVVEDVEGMDKKTVRLIQLKSVILRDLPNLKSFIHSANYEFHMPALERMKVDNCGLSTLFTCSIFRSLQNLKELSVSKCNLLEGIVVDDARGDGSSDMKAKIITLLRLSSVILEDLPILKSFSSTTSYAFNMPRLRFFRLFWCDQVDKFTSLKTKTGLVTVNTDFHEEVVPDLNDFISQRREIYLSGSVGVWDYSGNSFY